MSRGVTFSRARVVVAVEPGGGDALVNALLRMGIASVQRAGSLEVARELCDAGDVSACVVVLPRAVPDELPAWTAGSESPGGGRVPTLLLADALTHHVSHAARAAGYAAVALNSLPPRMLYRAIGGLLQCGRGSGRVVGGNRRRARRTLRGIGIGRSDAASARKPRLQ